MVVKSSISGLWADVIRRESGEQAVDAMLSQLTSRQLSSCLHYTFGGAGKELFHGPLGMKSDIIGTSCLSLRLAVFRYLAFRPVALLFEPFPCLLITPANLSKPGRDSSLNGRVILELSQRGFDVARCRLLTIPVDLRNPLYRFDERLLP